MPDRSPLCPRCGSEAVIPDVRLIDRDQGTYRSQEVGLMRTPDALFKREVRLKTRVQVCVDCGLLETFVTDPEALWQAHLERIESGWLPER